jgi:hypothetical protein
MEEGEWAVQGGTSTPTGSIQIEQGYEGMIRLRLDPPVQPFLWVRARRIPPRPDRNPPPAE